MKNKIRKHCKRYQCNNWTFTRPSLRNNHFTPQIMKTRLNHEKAYNLSEAFHILSYITTQNRLQWNLSKHLQHKPHIGGMTSFGDYSSRVRDEECSGQNLCWGTIRQSPDRTKENRWKRKSKWPGGPSQWRSQVRDITDSITGVAGLVHKL